MGIFLLTKQIKQKPLNILFAMVLIFSVLFPCAAGIDKKGVPKNKARVIIFFHFCLDPKVEQKVKQEKIYNTFLACALIKLLHYCDFNR
jgi:hypothetical protein